MIRHLRGAPVAVIDYETTGVNPLTCAPVSVAVVHLDLGDTEPEIVYQSLINPGMPIPEESTEIHGITDEDVQGAPTPEQACARVSELCEGRVLAAYNLPYDWQILNRYAPTPFMGLCGYVMARACDKYEKGKRLADVAARRDLEFDAHDAGSDALVTGRLLPILLRDLGRGRKNRWGNLGGPWCEPGDLHSVGAFWEWTVRNGRAQERDLAAYFEKQGKDPLDSMPWCELTGEGT